MQRISRLQNIGQKMMCNKRRRRLCRRKNRGTKRRRIKCIVYATVYARRRFSYFIFYFFFLFFLAGTRAIFIGLDRDENVRETAPAEREIRILISETLPVSLFRTTRFIRRPMISKSLKDPALPCHDRPANIVYSDLILNQFGPIYIVIYENRLLPF